MCCLSLAMKHWTAMTYTCCCSSEDGKDSMKFYTDPGHFFELWCEQMMAKDTELQTKKQRQRNRKPVSMNVL